MDAIADTTTVIVDALERSAHPCLTMSFQAECVALLHMVRRHRPDIPVLFLDTVHHFEETISYAADLTRAWGLRVVTLRAEVPDPGRWKTSLDACCAIHKMTPLFSALEEYDTWLTALRREQSASRASLQVCDDFPLPSGRLIRKINPMAGWTMGEVMSYVNSHAIPLLPLYARGYTSIGCAPCTVPPPDPSDPRSGRWNGRKLECGIHVGARGRPNE